MKNKRLQTVIAIVLCCCLAAGKKIMPADAAAHSDEYGNWSWLNGTNGLTVQLFSDIFEPYVSNAAFSWNYISDDVFISSVYYLPPTHEDQDCDIKVYDDELTGTTLGYTQIYSRGLFTLVAQNWDYSGVIVKAYITLNNSGLVAMGTTQINRTTTHEFGHALALTHPACTEKSIMHQSRVIEYKSDTITEHDRDNLKAKWE